MIVSRKGVIFLLGKSEHILADFSVIAYYLMQKFGKSEMDKRYKIAIDELQKEEETNGADT